MAKYDQSWSSVAPALAYLVRPSQRAHLRRGHIGRRAFARTPLLRHVAGCGASAAKFCVGHKATERRRTLPCTVIPVAVNVHLGELPPRRKALHQRLARLPAAYARAFAFGFVFNSSSSSAHGEGARAPPAPRARALNAAALPPGAVRPRGGLAERERVGRERERQKTGRAAPRAGRARSASGCPHPPTHPPPPGGRARRQRRQRRTRTSEARIQCDVRYGYGHAWMHFDVDATDARDLTRAGPG